MTGCLLPTGPQRLGSGWSSGFNVTVRSDFMRKLISAEIALEPVSSQTSKQKQSPLRRKGDSRFALVLRTSSLHLHPPALVLLEANLDLTKL